MKVEKDKRNKIVRFWYCRCLCDKHTERYVRERSLVSGKSKSCGCRTEEYQNTHERKLRDDYTGRRFGRLVVKGRAPNKKYSIRYYCECDCGNECIVSRDCLRDGHTQSCGCLFHEIMVARNKANKGYNEYDLEAYDYGVGWTSSGVMFKFDKEDFDLIKNYKWNVNSLNYITAHDDNDNRRTTFLHRIIMGVHKKDWRQLQVDHINGDVTDNRKCNLRISTASQNGVNKGIAKNNTSGVTGVTYSEIDNKWVARINPSANNRITLGRFTNFDDAVRARKEAEQKYYKEFSFDNSRATMMEVN